MIAPFYTRLYLIYLKWNVWIDNKKKRKEEGREREFSRDKMGFMDDSWFILFMMIVGLSFHFFSQ